MRILIVDDEARIRNGLRQLLFGITNIPIEVYNAENGTQGIAMFKQLQPDILFLDIEMPDKDGFAVLHELPGSRECVIVIISGHAEFSYAQQSIVHGVFDYLLKPMSRSKVQETLQKAADEVNRRRLVHKESDTIKEHLSIIQEGVLRDALWDESPDLATIEDCLSLKLRCVRMALLHTEQAKTMAQFQAQLDQAMDIRHVFVKLNQQEMLILLFERQESLNSDSIERTMETLAQATRQTKQLCISDTFCGKSAFACGYRQVTGRMKALLEKQEQGLVAPGSLEDILSRIGSYVPPVQKVIRLVLQNYAEDAKVTTLAQQTFLTPNYLSNLFKRNTGCHLSDFILEVRMQKAIEMLKSLEYKVYQVSEACGFRDYRYFCSTFKKKTGKTPLEYREASLD